MKRNQVSMNRSVIWVPLFLCFLLFGLPGICLEYNNIYDDYCMKGRDGYLQYTQKVIGNQRKGFWASFVHLVKRLYRSNETVKLNNCLDFWEYYSQDDFFDTRKEEILEQKIEINDIFDQLKHEKPQETQGEDEIEETDATEIVPGKKHDREKQPLSKYVPPIKSPVETEIISEPDVPIYDEYCRRGKKGYYKLTNEKSGSPAFMREFWEQFKDMIMDFNEEDEFTRILQCKEFWEDYRQDKFFSNVDSPVKGEKNLVENIFKQAVQNYWSKIQARMARFLPVKETATNVVRYTQNRNHADKLDKYKKTYNRLNPMPFPKNKSHLDNLRMNFSKLLDVAGQERVEHKRKQKVRDYFSAWQEYYNLGVPGGIGGYLPRAKAYRHKKEKLRQILQLTSEIDLFGIHRQLAGIEQKAEYNEDREKYYSIHHQIDNRIDKFYQGAPAWQALAAVKKDVLRKTRILKNLEPELQEKVNKFREIPVESDTKGFQKYFKSHGHSKDIIAGIVNAKFKNLLSEELNRLWKKGIKGKSFDDALTPFRDAVRKYRNYFGATSYDERSGFLTTYYDLRFKIPELYRYVKKYSFRAGDFEHMQANWGIQSIEDLEKMYKDYVHKEAENTFTKLKAGERRRNPEDFDRFKKLYRQAVDDMPVFSIAEPWSSIYGRLNQYYHGNLKQRKKAGEEIAEKHSQVALVHGIKVPGTVTPTRTHLQEEEERVIETPTGTLTHLKPISPRRVSRSPKISSNEQQVKEKKGENLLDFLDEAVDYMKGRTLPKKKKECFIRLLEGKTLSLRDFLRIKNNFRLPEKFNYDIYKLLVIVKKQNERGTQK